MGCASRERHGRAPTCPFLEPQRQTCAPAERYVALLLLGVHFGDEVEACAARRKAKRSAPSARALLGRQCEGIAVLERSNGVTELTTEDLAAPSFELHPRPTIIILSRGPHEIIAKRDERIGGSLVARRGYQPQVESVAATGFGVAILGQLVIFDRGVRTNADRPARAS